jgi:hypothetical protein
MRVFDAGVSQFKIGMAGASGSGGRSFEAGKAQVVRFIYGENVDLMGY